MSFSTPSKTKKWTLVFIVGAFIGIASYFTVFKSQPTTSNDPKKAFATRVASVSMVIIIKNKIIDI